MSRRTVVVALFFAAAARPAAAAQVVETPQPFDSAGRRLRLTQAAADSLALRAPLWPVSGEFVSTRLYRQSSGGYVLVVERPSGALERIAMLDETVAALRAAVGRPEGAAAPVAAAAAPASAASAASAAPGTVIARAAGVRREPNAASVSEVMGGQVLLGALLYGPLASAAINPHTRDATVPYITYLAAVGGSVLVGSRLAESGQLTNAQNALGIHMAVHGAAAGAALAYAGGSGGGDAEGNNGRYSLAALAGGIGGSALGMLAGRSFTQSEVWASAFTADLALLDGYLLQSAQSDPAQDFEVSRPQAGYLVLTTAAGYAFGPIFARVGGRNITSGDAIVLGTGSGAGMLTSLAIVGDNAKRRRTSYALLAGANLGALAADALITRRSDYDLRQGGLMAAGAALGALALLQFPGVGEAYDEANFDSIDAPTTNDHRALAFAAVGGIGGMALMHRALNAAHDRGRPRRLGRVGSAPAPSPSRGPGSLSLAGLSVVPDAAAAGRIRVSARLAF